MQHRGVQDPTLAALDREQEAIAVVLPVGLDLLDVFDEVPRRSEPILAHDLRLPG